VHHTVNDATAALVIGDDGGGFRAEPKSVHLGLRGLEERLQRVDGRLEIVSEDGEGTTLTAVVR